MLTEGGGPRLEYLVDKHYPARESHESTRQGLGPPLLQSSADHETGGAHQRRTNVPDNRPNGQHFRRVSRKDSGTVPGQDRIHSQQGADALPQREHKTPRTESRIQGRHRQGIRIGNKSSHGTSTTIRLHRRRHRLPDTQGVRIGVWRMLQTNTATRKNGERRKTRAQDRKGFLRLLTAPPARTSSRNVSRKSF